MNTIEPDNYRQAGSEEVVFGIDQGKSLYKAVILTNTNVKGGVCVKLIDKLALDKQAVAGWKEGEIINLSPSVRLVKASDEFKQ